MLRAIALALRVLMLRAIALALRVLMLRAIALALRVLMLRPLFEVSRYRTHAPRALALCDRVKNLAYFARVPDWRGNEGECRMQRRLEK
jgi:hypothetical protein